MKFYRDITVILAFYRNAGMLAEQYATFRALPREMKARLHLIVVDDGSPEPAQPPADLGMAFELYRIGIDVRWNQDACRNIGAHHAKTEWMLLTDIDHLIPEKTLERVLTIKLDTRQVYKFSRVSAPDLVPYKAHPNSWLMTREMYDRIGGYDERFAGFYGTDADFRNRVAAEAEIVVLGQPLIRVPREVVPDASTTTYERKTPEDKAAIPRIRAARAAEKDPRPKRLTFPYQRVA